MQSERSGKAACAGASAHAETTVWQRWTAGFGDASPIAVAAFAMLVLSCGDGAVAPPPPPPAPVATTVTVSPASATLTALEETTRFTAEVRDQNGQVMAGATLAWASSDAAVAAVDAAGRVTAAANGSATISATSGAVSGTATVTVAQVVSAVDVSPAVDTLVAVGDTVRLMAAATDANGHAVEAVTEFEWSSSDTLVARVDDAGLVESVAEGEATVTATASEVTGETELTVVSALPTTVAVSPDTVRFTALGQTTLLSAEVREQAGRVMAEVIVFWSSSDTLVVVVDSAGLLTAVGGGITTVTAAVGEVSAAVVVTVMQSAGSVVVSPSQGTMGVGDTLRLAAEAFDENGNRVGGTVFSWSSSDAGIARVDEAGLVRGVAEGTARITATAGDARGIAEVNVENPDRAALVALYEATDGPNWVDNTNWLTDAPLGEWHGVEADASGRVVRINLAGRIGKWDVIPHGLSGPIPPELAALSSLRELDLSTNSLSGSIPPELGGLGDLEILHLYRNELSGPIPPKLGRLANLERLLLRQNKLSGRIPPELGDLSALRRLELGSNYLSGPIPPELGKLTNLRELDFFDNRLTGVIPAELRGLTHVFILSVAKNRLKGPIPEWLQDFANLGYLDLSWNDFTGPIPPWLGTLTNLQVLLLHRNRLTGAIPPVLGALTRMRRLSLGANELTGVLPPEIANLTNLEELGVGGNLLTGPLPQEFLNLPSLKSFGCSNDHGFCVPGTRQFADWIEGLESFEGPWCNRQDATVLESLYEATDGHEWHESGGWLGGRVLGEWQGVIADTLGRVTAIDLEDNGLAGQLPSSLGYLSELTELRIGDNNALSGRLPASLARLRLATLHYAGTDLCSPADGSFREWLNGVASHESTGMVCATISEREVLADVYRATGGPRWANSDMWLTDAPLGEWDGVETDGSGRVIGLDLSRRGLSGRIPSELGMLAKLEQLELNGNNLSGSIPPALGDLENLKELVLYGNDLVGPIPPELGTLANLETLYLGNNELSGAIPDVLGRLENLQRLSLYGNGFSGEIPPGIGTLANLRVLDLFWNNISGEIPPEIGTLADLWRLNLSGNNLSGEIPPEIGALANLSTLDLSQNSLSGPIPVEVGGLALLRTLRLSSNDLSGPIPPEFATLANLRELEVTNNAAMSGALSDRLANLRRIDAILARGTGLCIPVGDPGLRSWLDDISVAQIASCTPSAAYLTQAVQSRTVPVPLVAGEEALLRVFVTSSRGSSGAMPPVRARFYVNEAETHAVDIPGTAVPIPATVEESDLSKSANAVIPAEVVQPGLEMVIEVDPDRTLDPGLGLPERIPQKGRLAMDVREVPLFDLTVIPFLWTPDPDSAVIGMAEDMAAEPEGNELLQETLTLLPVAAIDVTAHAPVMSSSNSGFAVLRDTEMIRVLEGGGHYMGLMAEFSNVGGAAYLGQRSSVAIPAGDVIAHELGHNMSLGHAPCGALSDPDHLFPYPDGSIGAVGYDFAGEHDLVGGGRLVEAWQYDLMSYCGPPDWISDYYFSKALNHRLASADANRAAMTAPPTRTLLLWGGLDADGVPFLDPAFLADAAPALPPAGTEYAIEGTDAAGTPLFSYTFDMPAAADAVGAEAGFVFALPVEGGWAGNLASITLSGPDRATYSLDEGTDRPMAILRDPQTGQVRGFLRDPPLAGTQVAADAVGGVSGLGMEVLFSRGIPDMDGWRR